MVSIQIDDGDLLPCGGVEYPDPATLKSRNKLLSIQRPDQAEDWLTDTTRLRFVVVDNYKRTLFLELDCGQQFARPGITNF